MVLELRSGLRVGRSGVGRSIAQIDQAGLLDLADVLVFSKRLRSMEVGGAEGCVRRDEVVRALGEYLKGDGAGGRLLRDLAHRQHATRDITLCDLLHSGIHPGWDADGAAPARDNYSQYPLGYIADLAMISTADTAPDPRLEAAWRVAEFHGRLDLPQPSLALPWRWGPSHHRDCPQSHVFDRPPQAAAPPRVDELTCELGLKDWALDVIELDCRGGPRPKVQARKFSLYWDARPGQGWAIEKSIDGRRFRLCCRTRGRPLLVPPCDPIALAEQIELRGRLMRWGSGQPSYAPGWMTIGDDCPFDAVLRDHPNLGRLHSYVLDPPKVVQVKILGNPVTRLEYPPLPEPALVAWRLAWWDRSIASERAYRDASNPPVGYHTLQDHPSSIPYQGPNRFGRSSVQFGVVPDRDQVLDALASALEAWPVLMLRCLALAEFLRWTLCEGGLGLAFKFAPTAMAPRAGIAATAPERS